MSGYNNTTNNTKIKSNKEKKYTLKYIGTGSPWLNT